MSATLVLPRWAVQTVRRRRCAEVQMAAAVPLCPICRKPLSQAVDVYTP